MQLDEATDVASDAHLIAYVRYVSGEDCCEELLFCKPIERRATAQELFNILNSFFDENCLKWEDCIGICIDGAPVMSGKRVGLQAIVKSVALQCLDTLYDTQGGSRSKSHQCGVE